MKKIALLMDGWKRYLTFAWPAGILQQIHEAEEEAVLYIFSSSGNWSRDGKYNEGEYNIFCLPDLSEFDGIILDLTNVQMEAVIADVVERAKNSGAPVISIGKELEDFYYVGIDNKRAMAGMVRHMAEAHRCRRFWFVMGPEDNYENIRRVEGIQEYLDSQGISWEPEDFYYESYEFQCGVNGFRHFTELGEELPDAIVCANDNIAVGVCEEAARAGFHAPEDFFITGFDNFDKAAFYTPQITTVSHVREEAGYRSAQLLSQIWRGEKPLRFHYTDVEYKFWESCGCGNGHHQEDREYLKGQIIYQIETDAFMEDILSLEYELMKCNAFSQMVDCVLKCLPAMKCDAMYLVVDPRLNEFKNRTDNSEVLMVEEEDFCVHGYPEQMKLEFSYENPEVPEGLGLCGKWKKAQGMNVIFPFFDCRESGANMLFLPLHFRQWTVGYLVIRDAAYLMERQYLHHMLGALTKAMENLHRHEKLEWMNDQLSDLYVRDTMTGMYNRMGYRKFAGTLFGDRKRANNLLVLFIDLDRLKYINDNLGHDMGDFAIRAVADAIRSTMGDEGIPVRLGGDEFLVIREELPEQEIESMIAQIRHKVERSGNQVGLAELSISAGYVVTDKESPKELEDYVNEADAIMYEEKKAKKAARI